MILTFIYVYDIISMIIQKGENYMIVKFRDNVVKDIREFIKDNRIRSVWLDMDGVMLRSGELVQSLNKLIYYNQFSH